MDLTTLTDGELDALRVNVLGEQERRANLAHIPEQIKELAGKFRAGGGDEAELADALALQSLMAARQS